MKGGRRGLKKKQRSNGDVQVKLFRPKGDIIRRQPVTRPESRKKVQRGEGDGQGIEYRLEPGFVTSRLVESDGGESHIKNQQERRSWAGESYAPKNTTIKRDKF